MRILVDSRLEGTLFELLRVQVLLHLIAPLLSDRVWVSQQLYDGRLLHL